MICQIIVSKTVWWVFLIFFFVRFLLIILLWRKIFGIVKSLKVKISWATFTFEKISTIRFEDFICSNKLMSGTVILGYQKKYNNKKAKTKTKTNDYQLNSYRHSQLVINWLSTDYPGSLLGLSISLSHSERPWSHKKYSGTWLRKQQAKLSPSLII